jgi:hypothetical protein
MDADLMKLSSTALGIGACANRAAPTGRPCSTYCARESSATSASREARVSA